MADELKIAVFASGKGSNLQAILDAIARKTLPNSRVVVVVSNNGDAGALEIARQQSIPAIHKHRGQFSSDEEFAASLLDTLDDYGANFIALAGYMKKLHPSLISRFRNRILNIHPALLPAFGGKGMFGQYVHEAVIAGKSQISGATVHLVDEEYDRGPVVLQKTIPVAPNDTPASLAEKVLKIEHEIYPQAIRLFAEGKVKVDGQHVVIVK